jgi:hypothetical protein
MQPVALQKENKMNLMIFPMILRWEKEQELKRQATTAPGADPGVVNWAARPGWKKRKTSYGSADPHCPCEAPAATGD